MTEKTLLLRSGRELLDPTDHESRGPPCLAEVY